MYCRYCGAQLPEDATFCPQCGQKQDQTEPNENFGGANAQGGNYNANAQNTYYQNQNAQPPHQGYYGQNGYGGPPRGVYDAPGAGWTALGFFFPLVGFILYLVWQTELPLRAKSCGKGALIGVIAYAGFVVLTMLFALLIAAIAAAAGGYYAGLTVPQIYLF